VLIQNIQRIAEENENLKLELTEKRQKITKLHEKNEKYPCIVLFLIALGYLKSITG
jgi:hypothetical protein